MTRKSGVRCSPGFLGHGNSIHNIIPLLKKENVNTCTVCLFDILLMLAFI